MSKDSSKLYQETYELPSKGLPYKNLQSPIGSSVSLRAMTVNEDKMRFTAASFIKTMSQIIKSCTVSPTDIDIEELVAADFTYLMYMLRLVSFGPDYKINLECPECEKEFPVVVDLSSLEINYLEDNFEEPKSIILPDSKDEVTVKLLRISDMMWVEREAKIIKKKYPDYVGDPQYVLRLESYISSVNGETLNTQDKRNYVAKMSSKDASYIIHTINKIKFGIEDSMIEICPHCGEEVVFSLPFNEEFFRPSFDD